MSDYHSDFWLLAGTIAPIIAIANVLTFGQAFAANSYRRQHSIVTRPKSDHLHHRLGHLISRAHIFWVAVCFAGSFAVTFLALLSLWQKRDAAPGWLAIALLCATTLLLFVLGACSIGLEINRPSTGETPNRPGSKDKTPPHPRRTHQRISPRRAAPAPTADY